LVSLTGLIQLDGRTTHLIAEQVEDVSQLLATLARPVKRDAMTTAQINRHGPSKVPLNPPPPPP
jgi:hypothetical protein